MSVYEQIYKKYGFSATQQEILKLVGSKKIVLEIGSSSGYMTKVFLRNDCVVDVVEVDKNALTKIPKKVRKVIDLSIEDENVWELLSKDYDFIIMADVLEHLVNPEKALKNLLKIAISTTKLLISMPNIASWPMRKQLFFKGDFEYQESGMLDKTHLHFYTTDTLPKLLSENGWKMDKIIGTTAYLPLAQSIGRIPLLGWVFKKIIYTPLVEKYKNLSYFHFLTVSHK